MTPKMRFMEIPQRLHPLLQQPDHLVSFIVIYTFKKHILPSYNFVCVKILIISFQTLHHTIEQSEGNEKNTACYDIEVEASSIYLVFEKVHISMS